MIGGEQRQLIDGPAGTLELVFSEPATPATALAVVCHPHPLQGGTMDNKVATTLFRLYRDAGLVVIRFNFRGVGRSEGQHDHARGECDDLVAVIAWAQARWGRLPLHLAGFSFGSYIAAAVASAQTSASDGPAALVLVAPPVHHYGFETLALPAQTVVAYGDADEVVPVAAMRGWAESRLSPAQVLVFEGVGHFFHGRLGPLRDGLKTALFGAS